MERGMYNGNLPPLAVFPPTGSSQLGATIALQAGSCAFGRMVSKGHINSNPVSISKGKPRSFLGWFSSKSYF